MRDRPVLMSDPMVRAIVAGAKTQTRRPMKVQPTSVERWKHGDPTDDTRAAYALMRDATGKGWASCGPFRRPANVGDRLWVRECFSCPESVTYYRATAADLLPLARWKPSIHMPRWASRLSLLVTDVRVERVMDISEADAIAEGAHESGKGLLQRWSMHRPHPNDVDPVWGHAACVSNARTAFLVEWQAIYGEQSLRDNAWVWVTTFERETAQEGRAA